MAAQTTNNILNGLSSKVLIHTDVFVLLTIWCQSTEPSQKGMFDCPLQYLMFTYNSLQK